MYSEMVQENSSQNLSCNGQQGNSTVVIIGLAVSFTFVQVDDGSIFKILLY